MPCSVGCTAFPLALQILDVKLFNSQTPNSGTSSPSFAQHKQQQLNVLIEAMKTYRPRYDGVDWVARAVRYIVDLAQQHLPAIRTRNGSPVSSWTEILQLQPKYYLRLAMTMDLSIRNGKLPLESDFPQSLRGIFQDKLLMPSSLGNLGLPNINSPANPASRVEAALFETESPEEDRPWPHQAESNRSDSTISLPDESVVRNDPMLDFDDTMWESGTPTTNSKRTESTTSIDEGHNPVTQLDYESVMFSSPVDAGLFGHERRESAGCSLSMSPGPWGVGLAAFEAAAFGTGNEDSVLERLLEI